MRGVTHQIYFIPTDYKFQGPDAFVPFHHWNFNLPSPSRLRHIGIQGNLFILRADSPGSEHAGRRFGGIFKVCDATEMFVVVEGQNETMKEVCQKNEEEEGVEQSGSETSVIVSSTSPSRHTVFIEELGTNSLCQHGKSRTWKTTAGLTLYLSLCSGDLKICAITPSLANRFSISFTPIFLSGWSSRDFLRYALVIC